MGNEGLKAIVSGDKKNPGYREYSEVRDEPDLWRVRHVIAWLAEKKFDLTYVQ